MERFRKRAKQLRASGTNAEMRLWQALRNRKLGRWKFRRQHSIDRYVVDFVSLDGMLVIEVDGATHSTPREIKYDAERTRVPESLGFHVVRITNNDVRRNLAGVLDTILFTLEPP